MLKFIWCSILTFLLAPFLRCAELPGKVCVDWKEVKECIGGECIGGDTALTTTSVKLSYYYTGADSELIKKELEILKNTVNTTTYFLTYDGLANSDSTAQFLYEFHQPEHGGGCCNCLHLYFSQECSNNFTRFTLCNGSASLARTLLVRWDPNFDTFSAESQQPEQFLTPRLKTACSNTNTTPYLNISFQLVLNGIYPCNTINEFNEGIEFSYRLSSNPDEWIPLRFVYYKLQTNHTEIRIGDFKNLTLRGYSVHTDALPYNEHHETVSSIIVTELCNYNFGDLIQFRWLQTSYFRTSHDITKDNWILTDITIMAYSGEDEVHPVLNEHFESQTINESQWPQNHRRNVEVSDYCSSMKPGFVFGLGVFGPGEIKIISRSLLTNFFNLSFISLSPTSPVPTTQASTTPVPTTPAPTTPAPTTPAPTTPASTTPAPTSPVFTTLAMTTNPPSTAEVSSLTSEQPSTPTGSPPPSYQLPTFDSASELEKQVIDRILADETLTSILYEEDPSLGLELLTDVTANGSSDSLAASFLFSFTTSRLESTAAFKTSNVINVIGIGNDLLSHRNQTNSTESSRVVGPTVLESLDEIMFSYLPTNATFSYGDIVLNTVETNLQNKTASLFSYTFNTSVTNFTTSPQVSVSIPGEYLHEFKKEDNETRIASGLLHDVADFFTFGNITKNNSTIVSDVISVSLVCGNKRCPIRNSTTQSNFTIAFEHSKSLTELFQKNQTTLSCVFLDLPNESNTMKILYSGSWSREGCTRNSKLSSAYKTVCECNHLTSFALLLSSNPPQLTKEQQIVMNWISHVGVAVSATAMLITAVAFILYSLSLENKSLLIIRNFIHINLCLTLTIAQIAFVVGVNRTGNPDYPVPIHCQIIAVFLHYFFLVSFMWMLMEGMVLYLALVKVFVSRTKGYLIGLSLVCYGLPVVYMGTITLPLGFALNDKNHYGYRTACFLETSNYFVWSLIAPVVVIFLANVGFFIMATMISRQQQKRKVSNKPVQTVIGWLKSTVPLVIILGLTWIVGVLVMNVPEMLFLAYIYNIVVAFQGIFIFLVLVVMSKSVRDFFMNTLMAKLPCIKRHRRRNSTVGSNYRITRPKRAGVANSHYGSGTYTRSMNSFSSSSTNFNSNGGRLSQIEKSSSNITQMNGVLQTTL